jgi:hypothetical protein
VKGGFFLRKKPLECVLSVYTNPENAIDFALHKGRSSREADRRERWNGDVSVLVGGLPMQPRIRTKKNGIVLGLMGA